MLKGAKAKAEAKTEDETYVPVDMAACGGSASVKGVN